MTDLDIATSRRGFFFWTAVVMAAVIYTGFGYTYLIPLTNDTLRPVTPLVHIHGVVYFAWIALIVVQTGLIRSGHTATHRATGMAGIALATALVIFGAIVTLMSSEGMIAGARFKAANVNLYSGFAALIQFAVLFAFAIRNVRIPERHKRFMLLASIPLLGAGINRVFMMLLDLSPSPSWLTYGTADLFIVAVLAHDWRTLRRFHPVTLYGALVIVLPQLFQGWATDPERFNGSARWLVSWLG